MAAKKKTIPAQRLNAAQVQEQVQIALKSLEKMSTQRDRDNLARFGIDATNPLGVSMSNIQILAKRLGRSHELAAALWDTGCLRSAHADRVRRRARARHARRRWTAGAATSTTGGSATRCVSSSSTGRRTRGPRSRKWGGQRDEFVKRAAFALLASLAAARQERRRRAVPRKPAAHRARRHRRTELRQEGRELGAAHARPAQRRAP